MEFRIELIPKAQGGWRLTALTASDGHPVIDAAGKAFARELRQGDTVNSLTPLSYPLLTAADAGALAAGAPHAKLCSDADAVAEAHSQILTGAQPPLVAFGRYLFELLIGDALWARMHALAAADRVELSLVCNATDAPLQRLPWELMHNGSWFLGQEGQFALVRRVTGAAQKIDSMMSPPRVLFVVGTELHNDVIQPGAEYLRLLQGLRVAGLNLSLRTRLLLRTTRERLEAALEEYKPDVVHFICHGFYDDNRKCYLQLVDSQNAQQPFRMYAGALLDILRTGKQIPLPSVVVLSACYTAAADLASVGQVAAPLAAELVAGGVPVAVGMAGRITDQACRLFCRRFYEALLVDGDLAHAAAEGRRAAIRGGGVNPETSVDWTMPTLFLADGVKGTQIKITRQELEQHWHDVASEYQPGPFPVFCDRLQIVERFDLLLAGAAAQRASVQVDDFQVLTIASRHPDGPAQYGRTWLMKELTAKAIRDGHVACLIEQNEVLKQRDWPKTGRDLVDFIVAAVRNTLTRFKSEVYLDAPLCPTVKALLALAPGAAPPANLPQEVIDASPGLDDMLAVALRLDFLEILKAARTLRQADPPEATKLVLLIDDVHKMGQEAVQMLTTLCGPLGLRFAKRHIRLVFMYSEKAVSGQELAIKTLTDWISQTRWTQQVNLDGFQAPLEEREAYEYFLLNWVQNGAKVPLTVSLADPKYVKVVFNFLSKKVGGVPSNLALEGPDVVATFLDPDVAWLVHANDDVALQKSHAAVRGVAW